MNLMHIKLKNGDDLLGLNVEHDVDGQYHIESPIKIKFHPECGIIAQRWLLLSEKEFVVFEEKDIMVISPTNQRGKDYYKAFFSEHKESEDYVEYTIDDRSDEEKVSDELRMSYLESKTATKH